VLAMNLMTLISADSSAINLANGLPISWLGNAMIVLLLIIGRASERSIDHGIKLTL
jgi:hypothetical protein